MFRKKLLLNLSFLFIFLIGLSFVVNAYGYCDMDGDGYIALEYTGNTVPECVINEVDNPADDEYAFDGSNSRITVSCPSCSLTLGQIEDCNDDDLTVYPGAPELCDGQANDCRYPNCIDQAVDMKTQTCIPLTTTEECPGEPSYKTCINGKWGPCSTLDVIEVCDGTDNNLDGIIDNIYGIYPTNSSVNCIGGAEWNEIDAGDEIDFTQYSMCLNPCCGDITDLESGEPTIDHGFISNLGHDSKWLCYDAKAGIAAADFSWLAATHTANAFRIFTVNKIKTPSQYTHTYPHIKYDVISDGTKWYVCQINNLDMVINPTYDFSSTENFNNIEYYCGCNELCNNCEMVEKDSLDSGTTLEQWKLNQGWSYAFENSSRLCSEEYGTARAGECDDVDCAAWNYWFNDVNVCRNYNNLDFSRTITDLPSICIENAIDLIKKDDFIDNMQGFLGNQPCPDPDSYDIDSGSGGIYNNFDNIILNSPSSLTVGSPDAYACYGAGDYSELKECCAQGDTAGTGGCLNAPNKAVLGGVKTNLLKTYDQLNPIVSDSEGKPITITGFYDLVYSYFPKSGTGAYSIAAKDLLFPNLNDYDIFEFDIIYNFEFNSTETTAKIKIGGLVFSIKQCYSNNGWDPFVWHNIKCYKKDIAENFPNSPSEIRIYVETPPDNTARFVLDNIYMSQIVGETKSYPIYDGYGNIIANIPFESQPEKYCTGGFRTWIEDLDDISLYPYTNTIPDYVDDDILKRYSACRDNPAYDFTGLQCCGDDSLISGFGEVIVPEYYTDIQDGCWQGRIVRNNTVIDLETFMIMEAEI